MANRPGPGPGGLSGIAGACLLTGHVPVRHGRCVLLDTPGGPNDDPWPGGYRPAGPPSLGGTTDTATGAPRPGPAGQARRRIGRVVAAGERLYGAAARPPIYAKSRFVS